MVAVGAELLRTAITLALLGCAAYSDVKTREVDDAVWIALCVLSAPLVFLQLVALERSMLLAYAVSAYLAFSVGFALSALSLWGWADFLALACIGLVTPPTHVALLSRVPSVSVLANALLVSCAYPFLLFAENVALIAKGERIFEGVEASRIAKIIALFTLKNVPAQEYLRRRSFYSLAERLESGRRRLALKVRIEEERADALPSRVWVMPHIPFVAMLAIGYVIHTLMGCLLDLVLPPAG